LKLRFFIDYRYDEASCSFKLIGVWMHNPADGDVDIYYEDPECPESDEANWILNRLVEGGLKTPDDFLEYHQQHSGYRGMRGPVREMETDLGYEAFGKQILENAIRRETNADGN